MQYNDSFIQNNLPRHYRGDKSDIGLWALAHKFCVNARSVHLLADYIASNLVPQLHEEIMPDGSVQKKPFFSYYKKGDGSYSFYLIKEYKDLFLKKYSNHLKQKIKEIEATNDVCDIRYFIRHYKAGTKKLDKTLRAYILTHAMNMKYEDVLPNGMKVYRFIFKKENEGLTISKKGMPLFVMQHQKALEQMGFENLKSKLVQQIDKMPQNKISVGQLALLLKITEKEMFSKFISSPSVQDTFLLKQKENQLAFEPIVKFYRSFYLMEKEDVPSFVSLFSKPLLDMGASKEAVQIVSKERLVYPKTDDMISIRSFFQSLAMSPTAKLNKEVKTTFLKETYLNEQTNRQEPVFVEAKVLNRICPLFVNKKAMHSFLRKNRAFFEKRGAVPYRIDAILGEQIIHPWREDYIPVRKLKSDLKLNHLDYQKIIQHCLNDTYLDVTKEGKMIKKPLFFVTRLNDKGPLIYAIDKKTVDVFVSRYASALRINPMIVASFGNKQKISNTVPGFFSLYQFWDILGRSYHSQFKNLYSFVKEIYQTETFVKTYLGKSPVSAFVFRPMQAMNRKICICIDEEAIAPFVKKHYNKLLEMGFRKNRLDLALTYTSKLFIKRPSGRFVKADSTRIKD